MLTYDRVSPGHVLSVHEDHAREALLRQRACDLADLDEWSQNLILPRGLVRLRGAIGGTVGDDLAAVTFDEVLFNDTDGCRPKRLVPILGRRRIGDLSFLGAVLEKVGQYGVYVVFYSDRGKPRAYIPTTGNALDTQGRPLPDTSGGTAYFGYDRVAIVRDVKSRFGAGTPGI